MLSRRSLLAGILASGFAPAIGHAGILMPVRAIVVPKPPRMVSVFFSRFGGVEKLHVDGVALSKDDPLYAYFGGRFPAHVGVPQASWAGWTASMLTEAP